MMRGVCAGVLVFLCACQSRGESKDAPRPAALPALPWRAAAVAHGGVGSPPDRSDGCRKAVDVALATLAQGADPVDAAVAGVRVLEDDPRFNAGTGARLRLDGKTAQLDAAVMTSAGRFGAVAALENVRHPVQVARAVMDTPHLLLVGEGATAFARAMGEAPYDVTTDESRAKWQDLRRKLLAHDPSLPEGWRDFDYRRAWNFQAAAAEAGLDPEDAGTDTVGVAVRGADGRFGVALSTGGTSLTLRGRVGDVPILGAGLYAGPHGAVAATGTGERILEASLARRSYDRLAAGATAAATAKGAVDELRGKDIGVIVISARELAADADRPMAWAGREEGSGEYTGPAASP